MNMEQFALSIERILNKLVKECDFSTYQELLDNFQRKTILGENVLLAAFRSKNFDHFQEELKKGDLVERIFNLDFVKVSPRK